MATNNETKQRIDETLRGIAELKLTLPLSKETKKLHTRLFVQTKLSLPTLRKLAKLDKKYNPSDLNNYHTNIWNVSKIDVKVNNSTSEMQLTLTPYSESISSEVQALQGFTQQNNTRANNNNNSGAGSNINTKELRGDTFLKDTVTKAIGTKKDIKAQADACISYFNKNHTYSLYYDFERGGKNFKQTWNTKGLNCGDGAVAMCNMLHCIGLDPEMRLGSAGEIGEEYGHYWGVVEINGKTYYFDHANCTGCGGRASLSTSGTSYGHNPKAGSIVSWK